MNSAKKFLNNKKTKKQIIMICLFCFLLTLLLAVILNVPFIGSVIDAILFEFLFGWNKIFLYSLLIIGVISIISKTFRKIYSSKIIIIILVLVFLLSGFIMESVYYYSNNIDIKNISQIYVGGTGYLSLWKQNIFNPSISTHVDYKELISCNSFSYGGFSMLLLFTIAFACFPVFLILSIILFITIFCLLLFKTNIFIKFKNKIIKILGGFTSKEIIINSSTPQEKYVTTNINIPNFISKDIISSIPELQEFIRVENIINKNKKILFIGFNVKDNYTKFEYENYFLFKYEILNGLIYHNHIRKISCDAIDLYIWKEFNNIYIKVYKYDKKIPFEKILLKENSWNQLPIGVSKINQPLICDFFKKPNLYIFGSKGSGSSMAISQIFKYYSYFNIYKNFSIWALTNDAKHIAKYDPKIFENKEHFYKYINEVIKPLLNRKDSPTHATIIFIDKEFFNQELEEFVLNNLSVNNLFVHFIIQCPENYKLNYFSDRFSYLIFNKSEKNLNINDSIINLSSLIRKGEFIFIDDIYNLNNIQRGQISYVK